MKLTVHVYGSNSILDVFDVTLGSTPEGRPRPEEDITTEEQFAECLVDHIHQRFNIEDDGE
jgi:hypothetical protein